MRRVADRPYSGSSWPGSRFLIKLSIDSTGCPPHKMCPCFNGCPWSPPVSLEQCVERLPRTSGTPMLPAIDKYAREPARRLPKLNRLPRGTSMLSQREMLLLSMVGDRSAPVIATTVSRWNWSSGPSRVSSRTAASSGLPTRRLATVAEKQSIAPATGTPYC